MIVTLESLAAPTPNAMATGPFGSSIGTKTFRDSGIPVLRGSNLSADVGTRLLDDGLVFIDTELADQFHRSSAIDGDLVFTCWGTVNQVGLIDKRARYRRYIVSNKQMKFTADRRKVLPLFLYYWFSSPVGQASILSGSIGSSVPGFNLGQLRKMQLPLPSMPVQHAITSLLSALDDKIDLNRRMNETLEAMARAIFKDWFVDFGPTRAKMEGRAPYLSPDVWSLFPDRLDDEGKPEGWTIDGLLDHANLISGGTPKTEVSAYWDGSISWASAKDVSQCGDIFLVDSERRITDLGLTESSTRLVPQFATVVVARGATTGRFRMFGRQMAMNQTCYGLTSKETKPFWLNCVFGTLVGQLLNAAHGSVFDTITTNTLAQAKCIRPGSSLLGCFEVIVEPIFVRILSNVEESRTLAATRDRLLPKLMSGEIRIKDAEREVANAL